MLDLVQLQSVPEELVCVCGKHHDRSCFALSPRRSSKNSFRSCVVVKMWTDLVDCELGFSGGAGKLSLLPFMQWILVVCANWVRTSSLFSILGTIGRCPPCPMTASTTHLLRGEGYHCGDLCRTRFLTNLTVASIGCLSLIAWQNGIS